jgi:hypothetical protein
MNDILEQLKRRTAQELERRVNANLPSSMQLKLNPEGDGDDDDEEDEDEYEDEGDEEGEYEEDDDEDDEDDEDDNITSLAFEDASREDNLACAAAAYRILGADANLVASHETGPSFFGSFKGLAEYSNSKDLGADGWEVYEEPDEILALDYDHDTLKKVIKMVEKRESTYKSAEDFYEKFHWGNPSNVQVVKSIPGVHGTLVHLGVARRIDYGANKNNEWAEYYHMFGEDTKEYPSLYAVMNEGETEPTCLVIHGGNMRVEPRGVVE